MFEKEMEYYKKNIDTLRDKYKGRHIILAGDTVIGDYDSDGAACSGAMAANLKPGTFMIRVISETGTEQIQRFANVYV
jgi:hypothetical protein